MRLTGLIAAAVLAARTGRAGHRLTVTVPGGDLIVAQNAAVTAPAPAAPDR